MHSYKQELRLYCRDMGWSLLLELMSDRNYRAVVVRSERDRITTLGITEEDACRRMLWRLP